MVLSQGDSSVDDEGDEVVLVSTGKVTKENSEQGMKMVTFVLMVMGRFWMNADSLVMQGHLEGRLSGLRSRIGLGAWRSAWSGAW